MTMTMTMICLWDRLPDDIQREILAMKRKEDLKDIFSELKKTVPEVPGKQVYFKWRCKFAGYPGVYESVGLHFNENGECDMFMRNEPSKFQSLWHERECARVLTLILLN